MAEANTVDRLVRWTSRHERKIRFLFAGGLNTAFGLAIYPILMWTFPSARERYLVILIVSQVLSVTFSYLTNKFLVFETSGNYLSEYGRFIVFHGGYLGINILALPVLVEAFKFNPVWAQMFFAAAVIATSYLWHSKITFRPRRQRP